MRRSINKARAVINSNSGETLIEGIVSILVFTVLIATITVMINVSLRISSRAMDSADVMQKSAVAVLAGDVTNPDIVISDDYETILVIDGTTVATVPIIVYRADWFLSFDPK